MLKAAETLGITPTTRSRIAVNVTKGYTAPIEGDPFTVFQQQRERERI
jgi:hypothetical protein